MSYTPRYEGDYIVIDKGIATQEMWKQYPHGREHVTYDELVKACELRNRVPLVLEHDHHHPGPLTDASKAVGFADLAPHPAKRGLRVTAHLRKARLPPWLLERITRRQPLPVSIKQFLTVTGQEQQDLLFDHLAILDHDAPRCPPPACGIGVADSKMTETPDPPRDEQGRFAKKDEPVPAPVPTVPPEEKKTPASIASPPTPVQPVEPDALHVETLTQEREALLDAKHALEAEIAAEREPFETFLRQRGITEDAIQAMKLRDLRTTASALRTQTTQGLPGTVPAPQVALPYAEQKAAATKKFHTDLDEKSKDEFKGW